MVDDRPPAPPLLVYVLWHPRCTDGAALARALYDWLSSSTDDLRWSGLGIPVRYRSSRPGPPAPIPLDAAQVTVAIYLIDEHWVADRAWRAYLGAAFADADRVLGVNAPELAGRALPLPTMLHSSAVHLRELSDCAVLLPDPPGEARNRLEQRIERLRRQVTQALGRRLLAARTGRVLPQDEVDAEAGKRQTVFISHAKADGAAIGRELREEVMNYGQLRPFFDENDLPHGFDWRRRLNATAENIDSLIAILTDAYASRPWCRAELLVARHPQRIRDAPNVWTIRPVVAIDKLESKVTSFLPEVGNVPVVRWREDVASLVLDQLVLEMVLIEYHVQLAAMLPHGESRHYITWTPDLPTVAHLLSASQAPRNRAFELVFPGHGMRPAERQLLSEMFAAYPLQLLTFEEARHGAAGRIVTGDDPRRRLPIGFSVGDCSPQELNPLGFGPEHLHEAIVRTGCALLDLGHSISYGGILPRKPSDATAPAVGRPQGQENFTETLRAIARAAALLDAAVTGYKAHEPLFYSYVAPKTDDDLTDEHIANDYGLCKYVRIEVPAAGGEADWLAADLLSRMRVLMVARDGHDIDREPVPVCCARILMGGKLDSFGGVLPGVAEEALYAVEAGIPLYVVGGFAGTAGAIAEAIATGECPSALALATLQRDARVRRTHEAYARADARPRPDELHERLIRAVTGKLPDNGLTDAENARLHSSTDIAEIVRLIRRGLSKLFAAIA